MDPVLIAGGGIAGLSLALTLHQIGVPARVFEAVEEMKPLGVGINLQPNAVRELFDLGIGAEVLDRVGLPAREWALVGLNGNDIHAEPRGLEAGYNWPQYAVHRGAFHMALHEAVVERLGPEAVVLGARATGYAQDDGWRDAAAEPRGRDVMSEARGALLIGADGIHSNLRAQMHPAQGPIHWGGALMWRGTVRAEPLRTGSSFVGLGTGKTRMVIYPISRPDADGRALINWIAEVTVDSSGRLDGGAVVRGRGGQPISSDHFDAFRYPWLDVPALLFASDAAWMNPMIDRDPVPTWVEGRVALMGDAAHAMYPTGSNGASQAIIDGRTIGAMMLEYGVGRRRFGPMTRRCAGRCRSWSCAIAMRGPSGFSISWTHVAAGVFDDIDDVIPAEERAAFMADYKAAAGFAIDRLNAAPPTIPQGRA
jgi:2-polyprenyl-6-methoxyphenol hydroxylase-like FAD-dependent oxidoreductase